MDPFPHEIFRCPLTAAPLRPATKKDLSVFNQAMEGMESFTLGDGTRISFPWDEAWRTTIDPATWYPVVGGIPVLTPDAGKLSR
jgi:uncharacterized protein YbaR (Trm112 family)